MVQHFGEGTGAELIDNYGRAQGQDFNMRNAQSSFSDQTMQNQDFRMPSQLQVQNEIGRTEQQVQTIAQDFMGTNVLGQNRHFMTDEVVNQTENSNALIEPSEQTVYAQNFQRVEDYVSTVKEDDAAVQNEQSMTGQIGIQDPTDVQNVDPKDQKQEEDKVN